MSSASCGTHSESLQDLFRDNEIKLAEESTMRQLRSDAAAQRRSVFRLIEGVQAAETPGFIAEGLLQLAKALPRFGCSDPLANFDPGSESGDKILLRLLEAAVDGCDADFLVENLERLAVSQAACPRVSPRDLLFWFLEELARHLRSLPIEIPGEHDGELEAIANELTQSDIGILRCLKDNGGEFSCVGALSLASSYKKGGIYHRTGPLKRLGLIRHVKGGEVVLLRRGELVLNMLPDHRPSD